jgi:hypothetical protein
MNIQGTFPTGEATGRFPEVVGRHYDGVQLDVQAELERNGTWRESGECPGPTAVGVIEASPDALSILEREMQFGYTQIDRRKRDEDAHYSFFGYRVVDDELEEVELSPEVNKILQQIQDSFSEIMRIDQMASTSPSTLLLGDVGITAGMYYDDKPDIHLDYDTGPFRYVATLTGPTTEFLSGGIEDTGVFNKDDGGLVNGARVDNQRVPVKVTEVNRFLANADPHALPVCSEPIFRIFINGYVCSE